MALIVQKFGGTSVGSVERIKAVAQRVFKAAKAGNSLVVVVSAMGKTTDGLVQLAREISAQPCQREMDMLLSTGEQVSIALLSMALQELGQPAISLTGAQVGIITEAKHSRARILDIPRDRLVGQLEEGKVVVVAGFQGIASTEDLEITTLGRGGSDTSAVAIAAALGADICEIYTDVPGILTTDPRIVPDAQLLSEITSDEMLELASLGAKVLHPRAVEIARNYGVTLVVRSSWTDEPGTKVISPNPMPRNIENLELVRSVNAIELDADQGKVALLRVPDKPGVAASLFGEIGRQGLDVDLIVQSIHEGNSNDIAFTASKNSLKRAEAVVQAIAPTLRVGAAANEAEITLKPDMGKIGIRGAGMIGRPGIAAQMFAALADAGININLISTSEIKVSCAIDLKDCDRAVEVLSKTFGIDSSPVSLSAEATAGVAISSSPVRGVALDKNQARLAILHIPDRPGTAAKIFGMLAAKNISVDMIIQSERSHLFQEIATRDIAFTLKRSDAQEARKVLTDLASEFEWSEVALDQAIAKISIVGSGMINQPGVAARMFEVLAERQINIQMIATSEIKVSCVVREDQGTEALQAIHAAFGLAGNEKIEIPT